MFFFECEKLCISRLLSLNGVHFCFDLFSKEGLFFKGEWLISICKNEYCGYNRYEYNLITKECRISTKENDPFINNDFVSVNTSDIELNCVLISSILGLRIEGACLNNTPFGYVCVMNSSNEWIYQGIMIGDKKECFGIEFYPGLNTIEYVGCYWNNERHGFGVLYDRKGELVYEGYWLCGSNDYERNVTLRDIGNVRMVHSLIHELVIEKGVGNKCKDDLLLCGFYNLERLVVKKNSFVKVKSLKILNNHVLKSIEIEDGKWKKNNTIAAFRKVKSVMIASSLSDD